MSAASEKPDRPAKPVVHLDADPHNRNWIRQLEREHQQEQQQQPPAKPQEKQ